jgi:hypothetical protein
MCAYDWPVDSYNVCTTRSMRCPRTRYYKITHCRIIFLRKIEMSEIVASGWPLDDISDFITVTRADITTMFTMPHPQGYNESSYFVLDASTLFTDHSFSHSKYPDNSYIEATVMSAWALVSRISGRYDHYVSKAISSTIVCTSQDSERCIGSTCTSCPSIARGHPLVILHAHVLGKEKAFVKSYIITYTIQISREMAKKCMYKLPHHLMHTCRRGQSCVASFVLV